MNYKRLTMALTEKLGTLESNLTRLQEDKDRLERMQPQIEGLTVERDKAEIDMKRYREENERLRAHYEVLKEHELNLIKDYESKIQREQLVAEQRLNGMHDDIRQTQAIRQELNNAQDELTDLTSRYNVLESEQKMLQG
jgi:DNA repair exonuclease SbcCD ATPase subunit